MRSIHSTRAKAWGKARAANRDLALQLEQVQAKVRTSLEIRGKVKPEKDSERDPEKVETKLGT
jgi:hypothetical protein